MKSTKQKQIKILVIEQTEGRVLRPRNFGIERKRTHHGYASAIGTSIFWIFKVTNKELLSSLV